MLIITVLLARMNLIVAVQLILNGIMIGFVLPQGEEFIAQIHHIIIVTLMKVDRFTAPDGIQIGMKHGVNALNNFVFLVYRPNFRWDGSISQMKKVLIFLIYCLIFCNSCIKNNQGQNENNILTYKVTDTLHIFKDSLILNFYNNCQVFERNGFWGILCFNHETHCLNLLNPNSGQLDASILLDENGYDIPPGFNDFYFNSFDSIFFTYDEYKLLKLNTRTREINYYNLRPNILARSYPSMGFNIDFFKDYQILQMGVTLYEELFNHKYYKSPILGNFNLLKDSLIERFAFFPSEYRNRKTQFPIMRMPAKALIKDNVVLSFSPNDNLFFYNKIDGSLLDVVPCPSNFIKEPIKPIDKKAEFQEGIDYLIQTPFYYKIFFDQKTNHIYRLVKHGQTLKRKNGQLNSRWLGPWSIIIIDSNYKILGEVLFPAGVFNYRFSFMTPDGLYIALQNPDPDDAITFENSTSKCDD